MQIVKSCIKKLRQIIHLVEKHELGEIQKLVDELSSIEFNADSLKFEIRRGMARSFFPIIKKEDVLDLLFIQDNLANKSLECANLISLRDMVIPQEIFAPWNTFIKKSLGVFDDTAAIIFELNDLMEASCGGPELDRIRSMIETTAHKEYESDQKRHDLLKQLYQIANEKMSFTCFYQLNKLIEGVGAIAHISEHLAFKIMMKLDLG